MSSLFLLLNASIVCGVVAGLFVWFFRSKMLLLVTLVAPIVMSYSFRHIILVQQLTEAYITCLLYGAFGIVIGVMYADYKRSLMLLKRLPVVAALGRVSLICSCLYLLAFYGYQILLENPLVSFVLSFSKEGSMLKTGVSYLSGGETSYAYIGMVVSIGLIAFGKYKKQLSQKALSWNKQVKISE